MSNLELGIYSFPALLLLIFLRIPIGLAMLLCGLVGTWLVMGSWSPILSRLKGETYSTFSSYSLSIIPLFLLMGQFASLGGMSQSLFLTVRSVCWPLDWAAVFRAVRAMIQAARSIGSRLLPALALLEDRTPHWFQPRHVEIRKYSRERQADRMLELLTRVSSNA